jgi:hypothetical protein
LSALILSIILPAGVCHDMCDSLSSTYRKLSHKSIQSESIKYTTNKFIFFSS